MFMGAHISCVRFSLIGCTSIQIVSTLGYEWWFVQCHGIIFIFCSTVRVAVGYFLWLMLMRLILLLFLATLVCLVQDVNLIS
jgi:hypothetical protein